MRKGAKRKATQKDQAIDKKELVTAKRTRLPKPVSPPDYFPHKRRFMAAVSPVGTEWDQLDLVYQYKWNFSNLENAFEEDGELFGKKVYLFGCTELEHQCAAIRAIRDAETERLLTGMRLLRSYFNQDQLQTPVLQFFREHLPNLAHIGHVKNGTYEVQWKEIDENLYAGHADGGNMHAYLLNQMSMAYPDCNATIPSLGGYGLSSETVKTRFLGADALNIRKFNLEEPSDTQMPGFQDSVQTPGAYSQRLSIGMTPKSRRVPKHGEMLLSVHGSPLGVYKEDNMEAIHESGED